MEFGLFPFLSEDARRKLEALPELYRTWNAQINVVSRKDLDNLNWGDVADMLHLSAEGYAVWRPLVAPFLE